MFSQHAIAYRKKNFDFIQEENFIKKEKLTAKFVKYKTLKLSVALQLFDDINTTTWICLLAERKTYIL